ncbi:HNH endonuclease, partial [Nostoc sp. CHAB 5784]|uniref:HNH endonuclease n=1 Tax=Nostoc mirabile TaxID=2907820 RepID=UPI001E30BE31
SKDIYSLADKNTYQQLRAWAKRRHPMKNKHWVINRYWLINKGEGWFFGFQKEEKTVKLLKHSETPIVRHTKVKGNRTPYDGDLVYWCTRMGQHPQANKVTATLLKRQKGKCTHCGMFFRDEDVMEVDHIIPKSKGGKENKYDNLQLLHRHCHDEKTGMDNFQQVCCQELEEEYLNDNPF